MVFRTKKSRLLLVFSLVIAVTALAMDIPHAWVFPNSFVFAGSLYFLALLAVIQAVVHSIAWWVRKGEG